MGIVKSYYFKKDLTDANERQMRRFDLYSMMLAARRLTKDDVDANNDIARTLEFYIRTHTLKTGGALAATDYMQAVLDNDFARLIKANLSYKPVEKYKMPEYNNVTASLISA